MNTCIYSMFVTLQQKVGGKDTVTAAWFPVHIYRPHIQGISIVIPKKGERMQSIIRRTAADGTGFWTKGVSRLIDMPWKYRPSAEIQCRNYNGSIVFVCNFWSWHYRLHSEYFSKCLRAFEVFIPETILLRSLWVGRAIEMVQSVSDNPFRNF